MLLWIIIGSLVGLVAIFLVVMSLRDRKKIKQEKIAENEMQVQRDTARGKVLIYVSEVQKANDKLLEKFVPSVGKLKMNDIKSKARKALTSFEQSKVYKLAKEDEKNDDVFVVYKMFEKENSNVWSKKLDTQSQRIAKAIEELDSEFTKEYRKEAKKLVAAEYKK